MVVVTPAGQLFEVSVIATRKKGKAAVELRAITTNQAFIKQIVSAAHHGQPLVILPHFRHKLRSLAALCEIGVLKYSYEDDKYYFLI